MGIRRNDPKSGVLGVFADPGSCAGAIKALKAGGDEKLQVFSPVPDHQITEALDEGISPLGWATLIGALTGLISGFALSAFTSLKWGLIVWGKPLLSWFPWLIVGFEFMILFGCLTNFITMLIMSGLGRWKTPAGYDDRFSVDKYGVFVPVDAGNAGRISELLKQEGAIEVDERI
jgi:ActD protein